MAETKAKISVHDDFCIEEKPEGCGIVIFGASGDLTHRKLLPSLFNLYKRGLMPDCFYVLGCARTAMTDDEFREKARQAIRGHCEGVVSTECDDFLKRVHYVHGGYDDPALYAALKKRLGELDGACRTRGNHIFYMALPPQIYERIVDELGAAGLAAECEGKEGCARVVVEKPFGHDLASARALDARLHAILHERQIYRIDHYLGKETVQNILMFRFANSIFEPIWNRQYIDHVQITVAESIGIEHRAGYYDKAGCLRDMFQNHMMQMMALVAMEPPASFDAERVRDEKTQLFRSIRPFDLGRIDRSIVRGQYGAGTIDGAVVPAYREEDGIGADSLTETFVAAKLVVDNWRWDGVPFYLRSGKRLARKASEIAVFFKRVPHSMFSQIPSNELPPNVLVFNVQPEEGIRLSIQAKHPGPKLCMSTLTMDFNYAEVFGEEIADAYERLLLDCMLGDQTLFVRRDGMEVEWSLIMPVLEAWAQERRVAPTPYPAGSWGPAAADELIARDGRSWRLS